jgi:hypothetical protein
MSFAIIMTIKYGARYDHTTYRSKSLVVSGMWLPERMG